MDEKERGKYMSESMDFYIDTMWSIDSIDGFYFRTHPRIMNDRVRVLAAIEDGLGFLAHLDWDWSKPFDPIALTLAAERQGSKLTFLYFAEMVERLQAVGVLDGELNLQADLRPVLEGYRKGFAAIEEREKIEAPMRALGQGMNYDREAALARLMNAALRNDHKCQYELAKLCLDGENEDGVKVSPSEIDGIYWLYRAKQNGNAYAARRLEKIKKPEWTKNL